MGVSEEAAASQNGEWLIAHYKVHACPNGCSPATQHLCPHFHQCHANERPRRSPFHHNYFANICCDALWGNACARGDACPLSHSVYEFLLHPTRFRSQLCKDGPSCRRHICFFAHSREQLRPLTAPPLPPELLAALHNTSSSTRLPAGGGSTLPSGNASGRAACCAVNSSSNDADAGTSSSGRRRLPLQELADSLLAPSPWEVEEALRLYNPPAGTTSGTLAAGSCYTNASIAGNSAGSSSSTVQQQPPAAAAARQPQPSKGHVTLGSSGRSPQGPSSSQLSDASLLPAAAAASAASEAAAAQQYPSGPDLASHAALLELQLLQMQQVQQEQRLQQLQHMRRCQEALQRQLMMDAQQRAQVSQPASCPDQQQPPLHVQQQRQLQQLARQLQQQLQRRQQPAPPGSRSRAPVDGWL